MALWDTGWAKAAEGLNQLTQNVKAADWNPSRSSLNTGAGTPWSAGNKNAPGNYADLAGSMLLSPSPAPGDPVAGAIFAKTGGLDFGGQQREEDIQRQNKERSQNEYNQRMTREANEKQAADEYARQYALGQTESQKQSATEKANKLENAYTDAYQKAKTRKLWGY